MKSLYKLSLILFLSSLTINANDFKKKHEKSRTVKKEFTVNKDAKVGISNKYGDIKVTTWSKNKVEIEVTITVKGNDLDDVEDKLNGIDIIFEGSSSLVTAKTVFEKERRGWSFWKNNNKISYKINYNVKMPESNDADLNNDYGSILLDNLSGSANINCDYGKITVGELSSGTNNINLDYCSTSTIGFMKSGNVNIDYSKLTIEESEKLKVNADYSTVTIESSEDVNFNTDYGAVIIDEVTNAMGNADYTNMRFGTVKKNLKIDTDYGGISIKNLTAGFELVDIDGQYAGIKIGVDPNAVFDFVLDLQYAGFRGENDNMDIAKKIVKNSKKYYEGKFGKGNTNSRIKIRSQYGGVSIKENN